MKTVESTRRTRRILATFVALAAVLAVTALAFRDRSPGPPIDPHEYAGDRRCLSCHTEKATFLATAHHRSSQPPSATSIAGSFQSGGAILSTPNPYLHFRMDARPSGFYQTAVMASGEDSASIGERFGVVIGSGRKGQSYLYWHLDRLYQLPVSYWTSLDRWVMSPGFPAAAAKFDRPVAPRCLECHITSATVLPSDPAQNRYDSTTMILGISCEKCHGPGRGHAARPGSALTRIFRGDIVDPAHLTREREVAVCAACHGGIGDAKAPAFSYRPGERLANYLHLYEPEPSEALDVHDNQVALLKRSACYRQSGMTCATCHDVHVQQRDPAAFSERCLTCHTVQSCGLFPTHGDALRGKCVDCHMPDQTSGVITSAVAGSTVQPRIRNHWIRVYPETARR